MMSPVTYWSTYAAVFVLIDALFLALGIRHSWSTPWLCFESMIFGAQVTMLLLWSQRWGGNKRVVPKETTMSLLSDWEEFERHIVSDDTSAEGRQKIKFVFYTGATTVLDHMMEKPPVDAQGFQDFIIQLKIEAQELANSIAQDHRR